MKTRHLNAWLLLADLLWSLVALLLAYLLRYGATWNARERFSSHELLPFVGATWIVWTLLSSWMSLDGFREGWRFPAVASRVFIAVTCLMGLLLAGAYLVQQYVSRLALAYFGLLLFSGFILVRYGVRSVIRAWYRADKVRRVVIVGGGHIGNELAIKIRRHPEMLCKVIGFLQPEDNKIETDLTSPMPYSPAMTVSTLGILKLLQDQRVDELILALSRPTLPELLNLVALCRQQGIGVSLVPQPYELYLSKPALLDLGGLPLLRFQETSTSPLFVYCKRALDLAVGSCLLLLAIPIVLPVSLMLLLTRGVAFRWETRYGQYGVPFMMLRLNVERHRSDAPFFERMVENLSISELPQLWNVLRGDMTLVGPRPEGYERVRHYSEWQKQRLSVKPGMTGLAQVHGLREQHSSEEKTRFDLQYLLNPSPFTDLALLLQTLWTLAARVIHYSQLLPVPARQSQSKSESESKDVLIQESLQVAHRSQSSAD